MWRCSGCAANVETFNIFFRCCLLVEHCPFMKKNWLFEVSSSAANEVSVTWVHIGYTLSFLLLNMNSFCLRFEYCKSILLTLNHCMSILQKLLMHQSCWDADFHIEEEKIATILNILYIDSFKYIRILPLSLKFSSRHILWRDIRFPFLNITSNLGIMTESN